MDLKDLYYISDYKDDFGICFNQDIFEKDNIIDIMIENNLKVDHIICDPPYNIGYNNEEWDNNFDLFSLIPKFKKIMKENGNIILFQGWSNVCLTKLEMDKYFNIMNWIVWDRIKGRGAKKNFVSTREDILWYCNGKEPFFNKIYSNIPKKTGGMGKKNGQECRALTNVWYDISPIVPWSKERNGHPTQKPLQLMERCIEIWTDENDIVLDFTMGSGTTCVACKNKGRRYIGIENDIESFNISCQRLRGERL